MTARILRRLAICRPGGGNGDHPWRALRFFNLYRVLLAGLFVILGLTELPPPLGSYAPRAFAVFSAVYLLAAVVTSLLGELRTLAFRCQLNGQLAIDIVTLTLLMHASGGVASGMGMLMVVSVAIGSMVSAGRTAGFYAALATLAVLFEQVFSQYGTPDTFFSYPQAGMLGATLFATATLAHVLARRARESEVLALQRGIDLENMAQLTEYVIQHMQTGVVVVDRVQHIRLANATARQLLGLAEDGGGRRLPEVAPELAARLGAWLHHHKAAAETIDLGGSDYKVLPRFMSVGDSGALIFLEDATLASRQVQQIKLAALGRLTASIAHEIRNPLGAISHAGQLLAEAPGLADGDRRLVQIVVNNARRVNAIIENTLQLGRRDASCPVLLPLRPWLERFVEDLCLSKGLPVETIAVRVTPPGLEIRIDPTHLSQILTNLCENALRHTPADIPPPRVEVGAGVSATGRPYLDVRDFGSGIAPESLPHLFEPFFTTAADGTGLGLYVSRELAQCNRADLEHLPPEADRGCRFRISFSDPRSSVTAA